jgi:hypothetical protein
MAHPIQGGYRALVVAAFLADCPLGALPARAQEPEPEPAEVADDAQEGPLHLSLGVDVATAYFYRGYRQEDGGFLVQPYADVALDLTSVAGWDVSASVGTWNSFHDRATGLESNDGFTGTWYERDITAGLTAERGPWALAVTYAWFTSPSNAWTTMQELNVSAAYADEGWAPGWSISPMVGVAIETQGSADGMDEGVCLQVGVEPGRSFNVTDHVALELSIPLVVGFSISDYFQHPDEGGDEFFGFASAGVKASLPFTFGPGWGSWSLNAAASVVFLGDHVAEFNDGDQAQFVGLIGVTVEF